jgi:outer membrane lipoprotein-sorting protein
VTFRIPSVLALLAMPVIAIAAPAPATGDLAAVQHHLQSVESMTASFTQTDRAGKVLTGALTLKKPGKIRFQYEKGVPILIVGDGHALTFIDYSVKQVQRWPIGNSPLAVLIDPTRVARVAKVVPTPDPKMVAVEAYDSKHPEYGRMTLFFQRSADAPGGLSLQGWISVDSQNNMTKIRLSNQRFNAPVSDRAFSWNDPRRNSPKN